VQSARRKCRQAFGVDPPPQSNPSPPRAADATFP
jgi:hypothetical protein